MPEEREVFETEHVEVFRVDRASLEEVLTTSREMEKHAQEMAKLTSAWAENMSKILTTVDEKGPAVTGAMKDIGEKVGEVKDVSSTLGNVVGQVMQGLGVALPALSIAGLTALGVQIEKTIASERLWAHQTELVSNLDHIWLTTHLNDLQDVGREYGYTAKESEDFGKVVAEAGFTGGTAMSGFRESLRRAHELGIPVAEAAKQIAYEMEVLGYSTEEVQLRTYSLIDFNKALAESWGLDEYAARQVSNQMLTLGQRIAEMRGAPALQMRTLLGLDRAEFERLQREAPEQLATMSMQWVEKVTKGVEAKYRPDVIEDLLLTQFGITDPDVRRQMRDVIISGKVEPIKAPVVPPEELAERKRLAEEERKATVSGGWTLQQIFKDVIPILSALQIGPLKIPSTYAETHLPTGEVRPEYKWGTEPTPLYKTLYERFPMMRGVLEGIFGTPGGGITPATGGGAGVVGPQPPVEVNVNLVIEKIPEGVTVHTSDGMMLLTRGQGEGFREPAGRLTR